MTITGDDRAFALRGLIALKLLMYGPGLHEGSPTERQVAKARLEILHELLTLTDDWIPATPRRDVMAPPSPKELAQVGTGLARIFGAFEPTVEPGALPARPRLDQLAGLAAIGKTFDPLSALETVFEELKRQP